MHTAQPALPENIKAHGGITDVRLASPVQSSIGSRKPTARIPLMLSVETVCPGKPLNDISLLELFRAI